MKIDQLTVPQDTSMFRLAITLLLLAYVASPLSAEEVNILVPSGEPVLWMAQNYAQVIIEDGVDADEARRLAAGYSAAFISGCGGILSVSQAASWWRCETVMGIAAQPGPVILVDAESGWISCDKHPVVRYQKGEYLEIVQLETVDKGDGD